MVIRIILMILCTYVLAFGSQGGSSTVEVVRHLRSFNECSRMLMQESKVHARDRTLLATEETPLELFQDFYFAAMQSTLEPEEQRYYRSLTSKLSQAQVSFVAAREQGVLDSVLMVASGQGSDAEQLYNGTYDLPFEKQYPHLVNDDSYRRGFRWEVGRARGGRHWQETIAVALVLMYAELRFRAMWRPGNWRKGWDWAEYETIGAYMDYFVSNASVYVHAATELHRNLYMSPKYGMSLEHTVTDTEDGSNNYILRDSLKNLLVRFNAFEIVADKLGLRSGLGIENAQEAVDFMITFRQFHIPLYYAMKTKDNIEHGALEFLNFTTEKHNRVINGITESYPHITYDQVLSLIDVRSPIEQMLFPQGAVPRSEYRQVFGTDSLMFVDDVQDADDWAFDNWQRVASFIGRVTRGRTDRNNHYGAVGPRVILPNTKVVIRLRLNQVQRLGDQLNKSGFIPVRTVGDYMILAADLGVLYTNSQIEYDKQHAHTDPAYVDDSFMNRPEVAVRWFGEYMGF